MTGPLWNVPSYTRTRTSSKNLAPVKSQGAGLCESMLPSRLDWGEAIKSI